MTSTKRHDRNVRVGAVTENSPLPGNVEPASHFLLSPVEHYREMRKINANTEEDGGGVTRQSAVSESTYRQTLPSQCWKEERKRRQRGGGGKTRKM